MTVSAKLDEDGQTPLKLPGAFSLLRDTFLATWKLRVVLFGYTAWLLIPMVVFLFAQGVPSPYGNWLLILEDLLGLMLSLWVTAVSILYVGVVLTKEDDEDINYSALSKRAWEKVTTLFIIQVFTVCAVIFGTILFAIPGILAWVWTAFAIQEGTLNNRGLSDAFKQSYLLTKGRFLAILWRLLVANIVFALLILTGFILYILAGLQGSSSLLIPTLYAWPSWLEVGFSLISLPLVPVTIIFHLLLYFAAKKAYAAGNV